ncbi:Nodule Cysteine-Rich (NCR) secreted peptide [Medicago truncatula]|uniref:Nodule Cysteine-Rich (NCR) secreted peptide n=2 Tax=Medicago truncatula TaxID=3880 RepID=G7JYH7_MEDTR|nr:Nodule Cysteine-Rich (NCR) secreted peptide [Medicago truncatula]
MQRGRNMTIKTLKFVYVIILFFSLFLVAKNEPEPKFIECVTDADCLNSQSKMYALICEKNRCIYEFLKSMHYNLS